MTLREMLPVAAEDLKALSCRKNAEPTRPVPIIDVKNYSQLLLAIKEILPTTARFIALDMIGVRL